MSAAAHLRSIPTLARGDTSAVDAARSCMTSIVNGESGPERLNAFISYDYEAALAQAERIDADRAAGRATGRTDLPLAGVPIALKDNICTLGMPTTCASRMLADFRSPYEATVVRRLRDAGAVMVGKTNMDELAMGSSTETSALGPAHNPHDRARVPGGSSGGSAAAVAAGMVPAALGTDTGGSVRQPAALCGVVGIRPTWGRVSRYGIVAFASSMDQVGVLARNVADAAALLRVISGPDPRDATSARVRPLGGSARAPAGRVVGVPVEYFAEDLHPGVRAACDRALEALRSSGCDVRTVSLPHTHAAVAAYTVLAAAEASTTLARFDGVRFGVRPAGAGVYAHARTAGLGTEVRRRIVLGTWLLTTRAGQRDLAAAQRARTLISNDFRAVFDDSGVDVLFTPTTRGPAFALGAHRTPYEMYMEDALTAPASLAGVPALSLPIGTADGLPVGGQLMVPWWREDAMLELAGLLEATLT